MFAPVYIEPAVYARAAFVFTPSVVIDVDDIFDELFVCPKWGVYCFGDFFAPSFVEFGIFPWCDVDFRRCRGFFDPCFSFFSCHGFRGNRNWEDSFRRGFHERRDHPDLRPPRTFADQRRLLRENPSRLHDPRFAFAHTLKETVERPTSHTRFTKVEDARRKTFASEARKQVTDRQKATPVTSAAERERPGTVARSTGPASRITPGPDPSRS